MVYKQGYIPAVYTP